jgi:elongation factor Ts
VARNEAFGKLAHELALQIAAANPKYISIAEVPADDLERETSVLKAQALAEGKKPEIVEKIVSGRISKFYEETVLLEQPYIKDESIKIKDMIADAQRTTGENVTIRRFARYELGESLE